jgi:ABC-type polysaccharide/polyol phosphate transport system ATPase subunit
MQRLVRQTPKQYFRKFWTLKDVSFEIKKGEIELFSESESTKTAESLRPLLMERRAGERRTK